jgi:hypothetical protein
MTKVVNEDIGVAGSPTTADSRLKRPADPARRDRALDDQKITGNRKLTDRVRASSRRGEFIQNILPNPPEIPGYKLIWLSTHNEVDPIPERMRRGYTPVKLTDMPEYESYSSWLIKGGQYDGFVGIREMILFKIRVEDWADDMNYLHHEAPLEEEQGLKARYDETKQVLAGKAKVEEEPDVATLGLKPRQGPKWN